MAAHYRQAAVLLALGFAVAGCRPDLPRDDGAPPQPVPPVEEGAIGEVPADRAMLLRHAAEAEEMVVRMHEHVAFMNGLPPRSVPEHLPEHRRQISELVALIERQVQEQAREPGEARAVEMMGIRPDQYRVLREDMEAARAEVDYLQTASEQEVRERMPGQLDRLTRIVETLESASAHMRRVGGA